MICVILLPLISVEDVIIFVFELYEIGLLSTRTIYKILKSFRPAYSSRIVLSPTNGVAKLQCVGNCLSSNYNKGISSEYLLILFSIMLIPIRQSLLFAVSVNWLSITFAG